MAYQYKQKDLTPQQWTLFKAGGGQSAINKGKSLTSVIAAGTKALGGSKTQPTNNNKKETGRAKQRRLRQSSSGPKIGDVRKSDGKIYSGENFGYQTLESYKKLEKEGKFRLGTQAIDRLTSSVASNPTVQQLEKVRQQVEQAGNKVGLDKVVKLVDQAAALDDKTPGGVAAQGASELTGRVSDALKIDPRLLAPLAMVAGDGSPNPNAGRRVSSKAGRRIAGAGGSREVIQAAPTQGVIRRGAPPTPGVQPNPDRPRMTDFGPSLRVTSSGRSGRDIVPNADFSQYQTQGPRPANTLSGRDVRRRLNSEPPTASQRSRNVGSDGSLRASDLQTAEGPSIRRTDDVGVPFSGRSLATREQIRQARRNRPDRYPTLVRTADGVRIRRNSDNTRRRLARERNANIERRQQLIQERDRRENVGSGVLRERQRVFEGRQQQVAVRNRIASRNTEQRIGQFRGLTPDQQRLRASRALRGDAEIDGRILDRRADAVSRMNRRQTEIGSRNTGLRRQMPDQFDTPPNPTIQAPRGDAPRLRGGRRIRTGQLQGARRELIRARKAERLARRTKATEGIASRQGTKTGTQVTKSTDVTKRGPVNPETGKRERLFTPESRAKALRREGAKVKDYKPEEITFDGQVDSPFSGGYKRGRATRSGGKYTYMVDDGPGEFEQGFRSINNDFGYRSDDELRKMGIEVRTKSGVTKKLNQANVANQQANIIDDLKTGETLNATPLDIRRAKLYARMSNGALDFVQDGGFFHVSAKRLGPTTWENIHGKIVDWDPASLRRRMNQLADKKTNRRLQGRRIGGSTKAQLKVKRNGR